MAINILKVEDKNHQEEKSLTDSGPAQKDLQRSMRSTKLHVMKACEALRRKHIVPFTNESVNFSRITHFSASDTFKLFACRVTKVGSTNTARLLYALDHLSKTNDTNKVTTKESYRWGSPANEAEFRKKLKTYTTYMFVRDPFERLLSGYRGRRPISWFKNQPEISFGEYLENIIRIPTSELDVHNRPMHTICKPCSVQYDFIGELTRFDDDMSIILKSVGAEDRLILPQREKTSYRKAKSYDVVPKYKLNIPKEMLKQIYEKYYVDYFLFGFSKPF